MRVGIRLLGGFDVTVDDRRVSASAWRRRSAAALVKLLSLEPGRRLHREQVIDALWPDLAPAEAAPRLHTAAHYARTALGVPDAVVLANDMVALLPDRQVTVDVVEFEAAADAAGTDSQGASVAIDRYAGDLLPHDLFVPWTEEPRARLRQRYREVLRLAGRWSALVEADPLDEEAHLALVREHVRHHRRQAALRQLDLLAGALERELGVELGDAAAQLRAEALALPAEPPAPAASIPFRATPVPLPPTPTVGRERDLDRVGQLLERSRLVTLLGPGGVGKTRLAVEAALLHSRRTGVPACFVDLTKVEDAALVPELVAREMGLHVATSAGAERALGEALMNRAMLLVLDNYEHVAGAAGLVNRVLEGAGGLRVLCTSRTRLHVAGEQLYDVSPLSLTPARRAHTGRLGASPAVALFAQAAAAVDPDFALGDHLRDVVAICRAVDGLPLAIELAAGHVRTLAPALLRTRLGVRLVSPEGAVIDSHPRQRTVAATIDWSLQLLGIQERRLFARLGVFVGAVPMEAIELVCADADLEAGVTLAHLVDASLVRRVTGRRGERRFGLLQLLQERARALLDEGEADALRARHAAWLVAEVEAAEEQRWTDVGGPWIDDLTELLPEIRAAHAWARRHDRRSAARLTAAMGVYWVREGHHAEARAWAAEALATSDGLDELLTARLHLTAGWVERSSDLASAQAHWTTAVERFRALGHERYLACALVWRSVGHVHDPARYDLARRLCDEGIERARALGERGLLIQALNVRGELARAHGDDAEAYARYQEALSLAVEAGDPTGSSVYLANLGYLAAHRGDFVEARRLDHEALRLRRSLGRRLLTAWVLSELAGPELALGHPQMAARLVGAADRALDALAAGRDLCDVPEHERVVAGLRAALGDDVYDTLHADGARLSLDEAADLALSEVGGQP
jgi:predicted ATPase/DNA-binding SARP family transcriptional activator